MSKAEKSVRKKRIKLLILSGITAAVILLVFSLVIYYMRSFRDALVDENQNYLSEVTKNVAANMQVMVEDMQNTMEVAGMMIHNMQQDSQGKIYLNSIKDKYGFEYVGYTPEHGNMISTLESEQENVSGELFFTEGMAGRSRVEYIPLKIFQDKVVSGLLISAPIYNLSENPNKPLGVITALLDVNKLSEVLDISGFQGQGVTYIIDEKGEIVLHTKELDYSNLYLALGNTKFNQNYSLKQMQTDLAEQKAGFASYTTFGVEKYIQYQYLGVDNWSVVSVIEKSVIAAKSTRVTEQMTTIAIGIMVIFPLLLIFAVTAFESSVSNKQEAMAKTAFLANMSHEIRTPMNAIVGISEILLRESITSKQREYVLSIINSGNGLLTIINDILDISKMEAGKFSITAEEYEFESLIYDVVTIATIRIGEKPIELMVDLDPNMPKYVIGDMTRVKQVLLNIIGNAVKFTREGYIKINISQEIREGGISLTIAVADTGIGIKKEDMKKLFVSFNQVDTHKNSGVEGTGLGLVISKRLCEMMGGGITVESEYEKGTTFYIRIHQGVEREEKLRVISDISSLKLLLLEEDPVLREHYASCMGRMNLANKVCGDYQVLVEEMKKGGYTHVLAKQKILKKLSKEGLNGKTNPISLLGLHEQSSGDESKMSVVSPLFTMQLFSALHQYDGQPHLMKRSGVDMTAIHPMPYVRVLLVDDNEINLLVADGLMLPYQMKVDSAISGSKAIHMIENYDYDLVFMDHMMPEMDGVEAVKIIRSLPDESKSLIPIVALTANVTQDARELFMASGFNDFLSKPIETVKLNDILKKWLREKNDLRAAQAKTETVQVGDVESKMPEV